MGHEMTKKNNTAKLTFAEACEYLCLSSDELAMLRDTGFVAGVRKDGKQAYPEESLSITQRLLRLSQQQNWSQQTLAWFADLSFATRIGRALLLPMEISENSRLVTNWLNIDNLKTILGDFEVALDGSDEGFNNLLRSVVAAGDGKFWTDLESLEQSPLYPLIVHLQEKGIAVLGQSETIARDASTLFMGLVLAFTSIAPPISPELANLIGTMQTSVRTSEKVPNMVKPADKSFIQTEKLVAVDRLYATKAQEIHSQPAKEEWNIHDSAIVVQRRTIQLIVDRAVENSEDLFTNILMVITPFLGESGRRVIQLLYEIANDEPYWRHPVIEINTNELLDRLGLKRDNRGIHYSKNRERLRDILNAAHYLEIVGEYPDWVDGKLVRQALRQTVLSVVGATYDPGETEALSTFSLFSRGLPKTIRVKLNFYDGIRRPNGLLGSNYVLLPRLVGPEKLEKANYSATSNALQAYFLLRYRQTKSQTLVLTRRTALEKANIRNKSTSKATYTLRKALDKLVEQKVLDHYTPVPPSNAEASFEVTLTDETISATDV